MVSVIRYCGHIFNTDQLNTWFRSNCICPVCRYDIRRYNLNASSIFSANEQPASEPSMQPMHSTPSTNSAPDTPSIPLNHPELNSSILNEERNFTNNSQRRTNVLSVFNSILDNFNDSNYFSLQDLETIGNLGNVITDLSGNNTSELVLNLLNDIQNNRFR